MSAIAPNIPKPMVPIAGTPILVHQVESLKRSGVKEFVFLVGHLGHVIREYFGDGSSFGVSIRYIQEDQPLGSGGSLYFLREGIKEDFLFVFGDLMFDVDFIRMMQFHKEHGAAITLFAHPNSHPFDSDLILQRNGQVHGIDSKNNVRDYFYENLVNAGIYVLSPRLFKDYFLEPAKTDFEKDVLAKEIERGDVYAYHSTEYVKDAGTPDRYESVGRDLLSGVIAGRSLAKKQKAVFLDRDGTINTYKGFLTDIDQLELIPRVAKGLKDINESGYLAIIVSNQPVIARGELTVPELDEIHRKLQTLLGKEGAYYDDLFYCPHHPDKGFEGEVRELKIDCACRKPGIGLILEAAEKYNIDLCQSIMVGDGTMDIQTGVNAGMKTVLVKTGLKGEDGKYDAQPDFVIDSLADIQEVLSKL